LIKALKIDHLKVKAFELRIANEEIVSAKIETFVEGDNLEGLTTVLKDYHLELVETAPVVVEEDDYPEFDLSPTLELIPDEDVELTPFEKTCQGTKPDVWDRIMGAIGVVLASIHNRAVDVLAEMYICRGLIPKALKRYVRQYRLCRITTDEHGNASPKSIPCGMKLVDDWPMFIVTGSYDEYFDFIVASGLVNGKDSSFLFDERQIPFLPRGRKVALVGCYRDHPDWEEIEEDLKAAGIETYHAD
jgi:hypothetical protein